MKRAVTLKHEFVEYIPDHLEKNTIYVSAAFATVVHKCCCGCENEVITPLSPTDWKLTFDGRSISLYPSIGNWNFACKSHYWIESNRVIWARAWSQKEINATRAYGLFVKKVLSTRVNTESVDSAIVQASSSAAARQPDRLWQKLKKTLLG